MEAELKEILRCKSANTKKFSVWVYLNGDVPQVFQEQMPNTEEVWFEFYEFNEIYWRWMESECVVKYKNGINEVVLYNYKKIKFFMIRHLLARTSFEWLKLRYNNGCLCDDSFNDVMRVHPRILRSVFLKVDIFPPDLSDNETMMLDRQCAKLFGKGEGIVNPHPWITTYCNLTAFWEKFGLNYYDILHLPHELFVQLKKIMGLESTHKAQKMEQMAKENSAKSSARRGPMRF